MSPVQARLRVLVLAAALTVAGCSTRPAAPPETTTASAEVTNPAPAGPWLVVSTGMCCHKVGLAGPPLEYTADCAPASEYARYDALQQAGQSPAYPEHSVQVPLTEQEFDRIGSGDPCPVDPTTVNHD